MANKKRQADRTLVKQPKKQRTIDHNNSTCLTKQDDTVENVIDEQTPTQAIEIDYSSQDTFTSMIDQLIILQGEISERKEFARSFSVTVKQKNISLNSHLNDVRCQIENQEEHFRTSVLPIFTFLTTGNRPEHNDTSQNDTSLTLKAVQKTPVAVQAFNIVANCEELLSSCQTLCSTPRSAPTCASTREIFNEDQQEAIRAFEAGKKMVINYLEASLADKEDKAMPRHILDKDETILAKQVMNSGGHQHVSCVEATDAQGLGLLLSGFGKVIASMQGLLE